MADDEAPPPRTDLDKLKALLDEWEVPYSEAVGAFEALTGKKQPEKSVIVGGPDNSSSRKLHGEAAFYTGFSFGEDGSFRHMGAWDGAPE